MKPHIYCANGVWRCDFRQDLKYLMRMGASPVDAYKNWVWAAIFLKWKLP